ncbi:translin isoform X1 [Strix aluco]|uniref:translin isoform X1 n=1 Tax=Strix aluco TaxID=111821 RepID=UPI003DA56003
MSVSDMFIALQGVLTADQDIREEIRKVVQALEQTAREILTLLQGVHQGAGFQDIPKKCQKAREHFGTVRTQLESLKTKFPTDQYYRFHEHWRFVLQRLVFLAAFVVYLESETLVTREAVAEILGIEADRERGFHLDIEDYLSGVLTLASELARLAVNSVTAGDYSRPLRISTFINELDSGFRLLNLKNDSLRKRYDGLKYDVKKIEEVVYDLSIRGLNKEATVEPTLKYHNVSSALSCTWTTREFLSLAVHCSVHSYLQGSGAEVKLRTDFMGAFFLFLVLTDFTK